METNVSQYPCRRGKVRDVYDTGNGVVIATTDRHSAFDVNMSQGIPGKGIVLTKLSADVWPKVLGGLVLPFPPSLGICQNLSGDRNLRAEQCSATKQALCPLNASFAGI